MSAADWARGEWLWFVRVEDSRTLWDVWCRAFALHQQEQRAAAVAAAAEATRLSRSKAYTSMSSSTYFNSRANGGSGEVAGPGPTVMSALWSAWRGNHGIGVDETRVVNSETRRQAADEHDEDWFINAANKIFEI